MVKQENRGAKCQQQQDCHQPQRQVFEKPRQRNLFEATQFVARVGLQPAKLFEQLVFIGGKSGFRPWPVRSKQPAEIAITAKSAPGRFFQKHENFPVFSQLDFEIFQGCGGIGQVGVPVAFRIHSALL